MIIVHKHNTGWGPGINEWDAPGFTDIIFDAFCVNSNSDAWLLPDKVVYFLEKLADLYVGVQDYVRAYNREYDNWKKAKNDTRNVLLGAMPIFNPPAPPVFKVPDFSEWKYSFAGTGYEKHEYIDLPLQEEKLCCAYAINHSCIQLWRIAKDWRGEHYYTEFRGIKKDNKQESTVVNTFFRVELLDEYAYLKGSNKKFFELESEIYPDESYIFQAHDIAFNETVFAFLKSFCPWKNENNVCYIPKNESTELFLRGLNWFVPELLRLDLPWRIPANKDPYGYIWVSNKLDSELTYDERILVNCSRTIDKNKKHRKNVEHYNWAVLIIQKIIYWCIIAPLKFLWWLILVGLLLLFILMV